MTNKAIARNNFTADAFSIMDDTEESLKTRLQSMLEWLPPKSSRKKWSFFMWAGDDFSLKMIASLMIKGKEKKGEEKLWRLKYLYFKAFKSLWDGP